MSKPSHSGLANFYLPVMCWTSEELILVTSKENNFNSDTCNSVSYLFVNATVSEGMAEFYMSENKY